jgi:hydroxymethylpyrimidine pyrophosphatase-like HAD family hydrolase
VDVLLLDMDGTLLSSAGVVTPATVQALRVRPSCDALFVLCP